jgi:hypothetical protein
MANGARSARCRRSVVGSEHDTSIPPQPRTGRKGFTDAPACGLRRHEAFASAHTGGQRICNDPLLRPFTPHGRPGRNCREAHRRPGSRRSFMCSPRSACARTRRSAPKLEQVTSPQHQLTGVAMSKTGRIFVSFPRLGPRALQAHRRYRSTRRCRQHSGTEPRPSPTASNQPA